MKSFSVSNLFQPTVLMAMALMGIITMMVLPVPAWLLDLGLMLSFALAILILTLTLFVERPLDFSSFPTVLLASLMLRLALNVSSTKLIIAEGHTGTDAAGHVIEGFAEFIMGGSVIQGIVIFCVLMIVNFMVITKGAGRMAEVGARFALDGMPGRQLAIDSDMSAGAIDHAEARARREKELAEVTFYGSLDGVSKFVKGDAIAGLLITLLNLVVGLAIGAMVHGMPLAKAFETYTILTVGDGLVGQIPAVIISVAAAMLLARGDAKASIDGEILSQLGRHTAALGTVAVLMAGFALMPGLPFVPFMAGALGLGAIAITLWIKRNRTEVVEDQPEITPAKPQLMGDVLDLDDIHIAFAADLVPMVLDPATGLDARIVSIRNHIATLYGLVMPEIRLTDDPSLPDGAYHIHIQGVEVATGQLYPHQALALLPEGGANLPTGKEVKEPVYGAPARWVPREEQEDLVLSGLTVVLPTEVLATHLLEVIKSHMARLLSLRGLRRQLDEFTNLTDRTRAAANRQLLDELIPDKIAPETLLSVLKLLLEERVSIRNLPLILEAMAEATAPHGSAEALCEHVRRRLGFQITASHRRPDGTLPLIQLAPEWEQWFQKYQLDGERNHYQVALPPEEFTKLSNALHGQIAETAREGQNAALVAAGQRRRFLRSVLLARGLSTPVLSYDEIGSDVRPALVGVVPA